MRTSAKGDRGYVILGHQLEVYLSDDHSWRVAVDGQLLPTHFDSAYGAWAMGAAESYRQGRIPGSPPLDD
jgi:hypothetical protein